MSTRTGRVLRVVLDGDLGLAVGAEVLQRAVLAYGGELLGEALGDHDRQRHQLRRVVTGVAEHQPLVAGALLVERVHGAGPALVPGVDALGDVERLPADGHLHAAAVAVEALVGAVVADLEDLLAHQLGHGGVGGGADLARHDHEPGGEQRLDRDATAGVVLDQVVEDGVADLVGDLVGVSLGHGFRGEQASSHSGTHSQVRWFGQTITGRPGSRDGRLRCSGGQPPGPR